MESIGHQVATARLNTRGQKAMCNGEREYLKVGGNEYLLNTPPVMSANGGFGDSNATVRLRYAIKDMPQRRRKELSPPEASSDLEVMAIYRRAPRPIALYSVSRDT